MEDDNTKLNVKSNLIYFQVLHVHAMLVIVVVVYCSVAHYLKHYEKYIYIYHS